MKYTEEQIQEAYKEIEKLTQKAGQIIREAEKIADTFELEFNFGIAYGMGGWYLPKGTERDNRSWEYEEKGKIRKEGEWVASSHSC